VNIIVLADVNAIVPLVPLLGVAVNKFITAWRIVGLPSTAGCRSFMSDHRIGSATTQLHGLIIATEATSVLVVFGVKRTRPLECRIYQFSSAIIPANFFLG